MLNVFRKKLSIRCYSVKHQTEEPAKFTHTINLPRTQFPIRLTTAKREELEKRLVEETFAHAYRYQEKHKSEPTFVLHDGPPYANGDLHMGHAVNKILKDITLRQRSAKGQRVHYIPGWDCHGLPIELKALSFTAKKSQRHDTKAIREACRQFAAAAISRQKEEFRSWGILADWMNADKIYQTHSPAFITNQLRLFLDFYKRGLAYRDLKPVYWSPSSRTALAEAELEYDPDFVSPSVFMRFKLNTVPSRLESSLSNGHAVYALVWTTTPWTLPSNQAICYSEELDYSVVKLVEGSRESSAFYILASNLVNDFETLTQIHCKKIHSFKGHDLQGCTYQHPIYKTSKSLPFLSASHILDSKGTGLVHTAPAHGPEDFLVSLSNKLPVISLVDENGFYTNDAPTFLRGKEVLTDGNTLVLEHIAADIVFSSRYTHSYPIDWRTKKPVIIRASEQWFINTDHLKERAVEEIGKVEVFPRANSVASKKALVTQVRKRPYWCISRQRVWGVPIPVFYDRKTNEVVTNDKIVAHICKLTVEEGGIDFWWDKSVEELLPVELLCDLNTTASMLVKGNDIFDIWFDSGVSWSSVLKEKKAADLYLEGADQFTGWFQSSLMTSIAARNSTPYRSLFVHGFAVDQNGLKMSKSLGNVISPKDARKKFGVDALRWWVASHGTQNMSVNVSDRLLQQAADSIAKIRAILRYLNGAIGAKGQVPLQCSDGQIYLNKYILSCLFDFGKEVQSSYDAYEYNRVVAKVQHFIANNISATYVHLIKDRLYCGNRRDLDDIRFTLAKCYEVLCKVLWPITPFMVEESWRYYDSDHAFHEESVKLEKCWKDEHAENVLQSALKIKQLMQQKTKLIKNTWTLDVLFEVKTDRDLNTLLKLHPKAGVPVVDSELSEILQVGQLTVSGANESLSENFQISFRSTDAKTCPRCRRFTLKSANSICDRCRSVLTTQPSF